MNRKTTMLMAQDQKGEVPETTPNIPLEPVRRLSADETQLLSSCEKLICTHITQFFQVGLALATIQQNELYRETHGTFEQYYIEKWGFRRSQAYRLLHAAKVQEILSPMGNIPLPENERQVRPLAGLPPKAIERVWKRACEKAGDSVPTGRIVTETVREIFPNELRPGPKPERQIWQDLVLPLLREALAKTKEGYQDSVEELLHKALLRVQIGHFHVTEVASG